jgi:hypothetical protein
MCAAGQRSKISIAFAAIARVLFTTLLFTAGGMGLGLFFGIIGMITYAFFHAGRVDMTRAYRHVAFPTALVVGAVGFCVAVVLEVRSQRTSRQ